MKYKIAVRKSEEGWPAPVELAMIGTFGFVFGSVGYICGVVGPIYLDPSSNLHPIQGTFVTGPGGLLAGLVVGSRVARHGLHLLASLGRLAIGSLLVALARFVLSLRWP